MTRDWCCVATIPLCRTISTQMMKCGRTDTHDTKIAEILVPTMVAKRLRVQPCVNTQGTSSSKEHLEGGEPPTTTKKIIRRDVKNKCHGSAATSNSSAECVCVLQYLRLWHPIPTKPTTHRKTARCPTNSSAPRGDNTRVHEPTSTGFTTKADSQQGHVMILNRVLCSR